MLLEKPIANGDVVSLKLLNGDEIIARFEGETVTEIKLDRPKALTMNAQGLGMIPWLFLGAKNVITLQKAHVFCMVPSQKEAADQYMQGTTGIAMA
jgi:hypothetical protein